MKIIKGKVDFIVVPVPNDAYEFRFSLKNSSHLIYRQGDVYSDFIQLEASGTILGKLSELTENQCKRLFVEERESIFPSEDDFVIGSSNNISWKDKLKSLLQSNGCWLKEWVKEYKYKSISTETKSASLKDIEIKKALYEDAFSKAAEDFLIILIN